MSFYYIERRFAFLFLGRKVINRGGAIREQLLLIPPNGIPIGNPRYSYNIIDEERLRAGVLCLEDFYLIKFKIKSGVHCTQHVCLHSFSLSISK